MLELRAGDCDDMTILLGSLLESIGHPVRLVLTGPDPLRPGLFSHIYLEVNLRGDWIPCDATMPHPLGWAPRALVKQVISMQEDQTYDIRRNGIAGDRGPAAGARLALGGDPRYSARRSSGEGRPGQDAVGSAAEPAAAPAEPLAQASAAPDLGAGSDASRASGDQPPDQGAAPRLGRSPSGRDGAPHGHWSARRSPPFRAPATIAPAAPAGRGSPDRPAAAGGQGGAPALNGYIRQGGRLYRRFKRVEPDGLIRVTHCRLIPPVVVQLGDLVGLIYRSDKWQPGAPRTYIHFMRQPPRLVSDPAGRQLFLVGGSYRITGEGIEG
jgi:hypothetical protein